MGYKAAVTSTKGKNVDLHFGEAEDFWIFDISDDEEISFSEHRVYKDDERDSNELDRTAPEGCGGSGTGCGKGKEEKIKLIQDCRVVISEKIGYGIAKRLELHGIHHFEVDGDTKTNLEAIVSYLGKLDRHENLRKLSRASEG